MVWWLVVWLVAWWLVAWLVAWWVVWLGVCLVGVWLVFGWWLLGWCSGDRCTPYEGCVGGVSKLPYSKKITKP